MRILIFLSFLLFTFNAQAEVYQERFIAEIEQCLNAQNTSIPHDLVIAGGAVESDWGRSRFALEGNALFGIRTYDLSIPHMKPLELPDANFGVKKYDSICASIYDYIDLLEHSYQYEHFQIVLRFTSNPLILVNTLDNYSENKNYKQLLKEVIINVL